MGIKHLNRFLREYCPKSIEQMHLNQLRGQKIAVDTSIYLYRFSGDDALIENMYLMISTFRHYDIKPIFIFDGKPPEEKYEAIKERKQQKNIAEEKYNLLKSTLTNATNEERIYIQNNMDILKKKFIRIHHNDKLAVKELLEAYGISYLDAPGEADVLCAKLVIKGKVFACLSEDMDMFVYGCSRVLRYLSLTSRTVFMYNFKGILKELDLTKEEFREICVVSGTDYNSQTSTSNSLYVTLKYFNKFKKSKTNDCDFYTWLDTNTKYVDDICALYNIYHMFDVRHFEYLKKYEKYKIMNGPINKPRLEEILEKDGFLFV